MKKLFFIAFCFLTSSTSVLVAKSIDPNFKWQQSFLFSPPNVHEKSFAEIAKLIVGKTIVTGDFLHGFQIEYIDANGVSALWYGKNKRVLKARWKLAPMYDNPFKKVICWNYGSGTFNPVTKQSGGLDCSDIEEYLQRVKEHAKGDVLNLMSGAIPTPGKAPTSLGFIQNDLRWQNKKK